MLRFSLHALRSTSCGHPLIPITYVRQSQQWPPPHAQVLPPEEGKDAGKKRAKKSETTDMPKRPTTSFILFMSSFKDELKKQNPNIKTAVTLSKSAGTKWKSMSEEEKLPYIKLAAEEKAAYQTKLESYKSKQFTEDKEKHVACSGSDSLVLQSTDLNILEVVVDNMIDFSIISTPNII